MLEPYIGDATGIAAVTGLHKIYTAQGGQVYIYSTVDGTAIDNQYVTVTGTAYDVAYMDAIDRRGQHRLLIHGRRRLLTESLANGFRSADVLAIAAHRDDVEQTCGGTLLRMASRGLRTAILDLTQGEAGTRGSAEERAAEAAEAAKLLGVGWRQALDCPTARSKTLSKTGSRLCACCGSCGRAW